MILCRCPREDMLKYSFSADISSVDEVYELFKASLSVRKKCLRQMCQFLVVSGYTLFKFYSISIVFVKVASYFLCVEKSDLIV